MCARTPSLNAHLHLLTSPAEMQETRSPKGRNALFLRLVFTSLGLVRTTETNVSGFFNQRLVKYIGIVRTKGTEKLKETIIGLVCKVQFE